MNITEDQMKRIVEDFIAVCLEVAKDAHEFIGTHELDARKYDIHRYPTLFTEIFYDERYMNAEQRGEIPFLKYNIPKYEVQPYQYPKDKKCYSMIFESYPADHINIEQYKKIEEIRKWINSEPEVLKAFTDKKELSEYSMREIVISIVKRYLYTTNATESIPDDLEEKIKVYVIKKLSFFLSDTLYFDIGIPICLVTFHRDTIKLDDNVEIVRISDDLQKARQVLCKYEVGAENWLAACATHMIVLHNYNFAKTEGESFDYVTQNYNAYPLQIIDDIVGIIRVVTGYEIGYEQMFCMPIYWMYRTVADLQELYGARTHFVNSKFVDTDWARLPVSYATDNQCDEIISCYKQYQDNAKQLRFPLMRFNRCMLRDQIDDMTTDACIGLESLLAGGTHGEISSTIASRMPIVLSKGLKSDYAPDKSRTYMKKIYNLRSRIVHGDKLREKDIYIAEGKNRVDIRKAAVDFLRLTLSFMIKNPEYLDVQNIDRYIDTLIAEHSV